jgi:hypothetical protein
MWKLENRRTDIYLAGRRLVLVKYTDTFQFCLKQDNDKIPFAKNAWTFLYMHAFRNLVNTRIGLKVLGTKVVNRNETSKISGSHRDKYEDHFSGVSRRVANDVSDVFNCF